MVWVQVGTQTGRSNIGGYWAVSQYTVQYPVILDSITGYCPVSCDTGRYHRISDGIRILDCIRILSDIRILLDIRQKRISASIRMLLLLGGRIRISVTEPDIRFLRIRLRALVPTPQGSRRRAA